MSDEKITCPCCGEDITDFVHAAVTKRIRQINAEKMRRRQSNDPELRQQLNEASAERLKEWRKKNPDKVRAATTQASHARTEETFARQAATLKETNRRKAIKFSELLLAARTSGLKVTPEVESDLMKQASTLVKEAMKAERRAAKKSQQQGAGTR